MTFEEQLKQVFDAAVKEATVLAANELNRAREGGVAEGRTDGWNKGWNDGRAEAEELGRAALEAAVAAGEARSSVDLDARERLLEAIRAIDRARSLTEVLDTLAGSAAREVRHANVFIVNGGGVRMWGGPGVGSSLGDDHSVEFPLRDAGVIARAVQTGATASGDHADAPPFAALAPGHECLAVPMTLAGEVVAVLYADRDDSGGPDSGAGTTGSISDALEILSRHAARSLEALTASKAARSLLLQSASTGHQAKPVT